MLYREIKRDAGIKNEFDHSYLLFLMEEEKREEYSFQMLLQNEIPGLLSCRVRYIEEDSYYSYEISSKRSLLQEYRDKKLYYADLKELFYKINGIIKKATDYLLEKDGFLLDPEYIFMDSQTEELYCVYLPVNDCPDTNVERYRGLAEFLLERTDHKDEHAVNAVYQFYKMSKEEFFSFEAFIGFFEKEDLMMQAKERKLEERKNFSDESSVMDREENEEETIGKDRIEERICFHWKVQSALLITGVLLTVTALFFPAVKMFSLHLLLPGLTLNIISVILWGLAFYHWFKGKQQEDYMEMDSSVTVEEYFDDMLDNETVYFDEDLTLRLKWKEGHFSKEYALMTFPVTVGKLKESVQMCMEDASISRLHARFIQQDEAVVLQDLDSTNGTWVNGKKLAAGEETVIRRNDEIQFGKIIVNVV